MNVKSVLLIITILALGGCTAHKKTVRTARTQDQTITKIAEAANSVSDSLVKLAATQAAATPPRKDKYLPDPYTFGMTHIASLDWSGPIAPLVRKIADASDYKLRILGREPAIPIIISISAKSTPLSHILRDIDFQAGKSADIRVYAKRKEIELRYARA